MKNRILPSTLIVAMALPMFGPTAQASKIVNAQDEVARLLGHAPTVVNVYDAHQKRLTRAKTENQPWSGSYWPDILGGISSHWRDQGLALSKFRFALRYGVAKSAFQNDFKNVSEKYTKWDPSELAVKLSPTEKYDLLVGDTNFSLTKAVLEETDFRANHRVTTKNRDGSEIDTDDEAEGNAPRVETTTKFKPGTRDENNNDPAYAEFDSKFLYKYWRKKGGTLAYWSGICDGWGPASVYLPRPGKAVTVTGALGHQLTFYPDDIKALGSYLFARTNTTYGTPTMNYRFSGRMCSEKGEPDSNKANGQVKDLRCNDLDPGVFHLALLNRIGQDKMGFIMDVDNNNKINNHPIYGYSFAYVNPLTGETSAMKNAIVERSQLKDGYYDQRDPRTKFIMGVRTTVNMLYYIFPEAKRIREKYSVGPKAVKRNQDFDYPGQDAVSTETYEYDLELDADGNILGGEWGNRHDDKDGKVKYSLQPDFIWMADKNALPFSEMAEYVNPGILTDTSNNRPFGNMKWNWDGKSPMPEDWIMAARADTTWIAPLTVESKDAPVPEAAKNAGLKSAQPLSHIVYWLFDQSRVRDQR